MTEPTTTSTWSAPAVEPLPQVTDAALTPFGSGSDLAIYSSFI